MLVSKVISAFVGEEFAVGKSLLIDMGPEVAQVRKQVIQEKCPNSVQRQSVPLG